MKPSERLLRIHKNLQTLRHALRVIENSVGEIAHAEDYLGVDIKCCLPGAEEQASSEDETAAILAEQKTEPKAIGPMTIEKLIRKLDEGCYDWEKPDDLRADLQDLVHQAVQSQARRDSDLCFVTACPHCWKLIIQAAGLE